MARADVKPTVPVRDQSVGMLVLGETQHGLANVLLELPTAVFMVVICVAIQILELVDVLVQPDQPQPPHQPPCLVVAEVARLDREMCVRQSIPA